MQADLFGTPQLDPALSQWHTPAWIARNLAHWVQQPRVRILEPACGSGNLVEPLYRRGHKPSLITCVELDPAWADFARARFENDIAVHHDNFLDLSPRTLGMFDVVLMNPPFEDGLHIAFLEHALKFAPRVVGIFPVAVQFGEERDRDVWAHKARVSRRAILPVRVKYGGSSQASFETVALEVVARERSRRPGEVLTISEEVWREGEAA